MKKEMIERLKKETLEFDDYGKPIINNAILMFKNFKGEERRDRETNDIVNAEGDRNFAIALRSDIAEELAGLGYNVKVRPDNEDPEGEPLPYLQVKVSYKFDDSRRPVIKQYTSKTGPEGEELDEDEVGDLDKAPYEKAMVRFNAYRWKKGGRKGITAYLKNLNIVIKEDSFDKYWDYAPVISDEEAIPFEEE